MEFFRCLRRRLPHGESAEALSFAQVPLSGWPPGERLSAPLPAAAATAAPRTDLELLGERLQATCLQVRRLGGPMEIVLREGWLQGATVRVELGGEFFCFRIKIPSARQREQLRKALGHIAASLSAAGLRPGKFEVTR